MVSAYFNNILSTKSKLSESEQKWFDLIVNRMVNNAHEVDQKLRNTLNAEKRYRMADLFGGDRSAVLKHFLGERMTAKYLAWLEKLGSIPYTSGYYRRPVRSLDARLHVSVALDSLKDFLAIEASGLPLEILMEGGRTEQERTFIDDIEYYHLMSVEIDAGNEAIIEKTKDIICGDNNAGRISYDLLRGIVASRNTGLYELEGKLLLAARLQEGLRQSIAETMDSGVPEAFLYLFNIIRENDLQRFSSIKRAVGTWTGLVNEANAERVNQKILDLIYHVLTDREYAESCLASEDSIECYIALWSKGFYRMEDLEDCAARIIDEGLRHKIQVLFYYLTATEDNWMRERLSKQALERYSDDLSIVAAFQGSYLHGVYLGGYSSSKERNDSCFESLEEARRHYELWKGVYERIQKKQTFSPFIFPWHSAEVSRQSVAGKMAAIVFVIGSDRMLDDLCSFYDQMDSETRYGVVRELLKDPSTPIQLDTLIKALGDRAEYPRKSAFEILDKLPCDRLDCKRIEELLKYKTGNLRQQAIRLLLKQSPSSLGESIERLLTAPVAEKRLAGMDLLLSVGKDADYADVCRQSIPLLRQIDSPTSKELLLIEQLVGETTSSARYVKENGFGLYDPKEHISLPEEKPAPDFHIKKAFPLLQGDSFLKKIFGKSSQGIFEIMEKLDRILDTYKNYEYTSTYGNHTLLGNYFWEMKSADEEPNQLDRYPLAEVWREFYANEIGDFDTLLQLCFALSSNWGEEDHYGGMKLFSSTLVSFFGFDLYALKYKISQLPNAKTASRVIELLAVENWDHQKAIGLSQNVLTSLFPVLNDKNFSHLHEYTTYGDRMERYTTFIFHDARIAYWLSDMFGWRTNEEFIRFFNIHYYFYRRANFFQVDPPSHYESNNLTIYDFVKAHAMGLIPESEVIRELMERKYSADTIATATRYLNNTLNHWERQILKRYEGNTDLSSLREIVGKVVDRILDIELKRGDSVTEVSPLALKIERVEGASYLVRILTAFGKDTFGRSDYYYNSDYTKKEVFSKLLRCCYPSPTDTSDTLSVLLPGTGITAERLVEAAMYAPQWLEIIEGCIGWKGLTSAAYYFHAHINESCDDKKKAIIARYTPIDPEDLRLGAFDIDWFREAYDEIGEKRFNVVYDAAKYISSGAGHTRARKYADAVNGKLMATLAKKQIVDKRNKDLLMAYCLIPLDRKSRKDLLGRYQYLQRFLKESKAFGSQRQESEKKAAQIGMQNLARNAGYGDVTRLVWAMETELIREMRPYFEPKEIEGVGVYVEVDNEGKSELKCVKGEKSLNAIPAKLKKNPYIEELKQVHKNLKDQYARSRIMLEQAMEDETSFYIRELDELTRNPVVWPLLKNLVFVSDTDTGFFADRKLVTPDGKTSRQKEDTIVRIAHPVDLYNRDVWHTYQKYLYDKRLRQPFKQVFRELYVKTEEELPAMHSMRYAGCQIQPQKTVAVLKGRRWVANYEDGLQKVYYKENIVATIYALADWFSPADIEAPTLEWVAFHERKGYNPIRMSEIPEVIFSEVMRDVDLAVSVAHAGGVDPEASHSTVEMRRAMVEFTLPLFKLTNVRLEGSHAFVMGQLANYNIHLGSGVIHQEAGAAINVLPVHSQHRGRLFLPFVDEDPKTAEIITKILFFADDRKIKDPFILDQIRMR